VRTLGDKIKLLIKDRNEAMHCGYLLRAKDL